MNHMNTEFLLMRTVLGNKNVLLNRISGGIKRPIVVLSSFEMASRALTSSVVENRQNSQKIISQHELSKYHKSGLAKYCQRFPRHISRSDKSKGFCDGLLAVSRLGSDGFPNVGARMYSTDNRNDRNTPRTEIKGVVFHVPHPVEWLKNLFYMFIVQGWLDSSFSRQEFLFGAKQAVCYLTRLAVLQDFDGMKLIASKEVVSKMQEIVSALSLEQLQSLEILPENINLAKFAVSSISQLEEGSYNVSIDVFCLAVRSFRSQPLLIQTILRFNRDYTQENRGDWRIDSIQEFNIRELGSVKTHDGSRTK